MDDAELLHRYADDGVEEAFSELVRRHLNLVYSTALRRVGDDAHLAKDVTQKVFIALARQAASVSDRPVLAGWLYTTSRFAAAQVVRSERRRKTREQKAYALDEFIVDSPPDPEWTRIRPALDAIMDELNERDREALLLRFFSGQAFAEVGRNLGLTEEAARKRVDRALDKLRSMLAKRGVSSTAVAAAALLANQAVASAPAGLAGTVTGTALASAGAAGAPALSFLRWLLGPSQLGLGAAGVLGLAAVVDLPAIGVAFHQLQAAHRAEASLAIAGRDYAAQLDHLRTLERSAVAAPVPAAPAAGFGVAARDPKGEGRKFLAEFPQARAMLIERGASGSLRINGPFYRQAGLASVQIDRLEKLTAQSWVDNLAVTPTLISAGGQPSDGQLQDLLGAAGFQQYQDYSRRVDAYAWAGAVARELNFAGVPLATAQTDQLAQILANSSSIYQDGGALNWSSVDENDAEASVDWEAALPQVQGLLSAAQWQAARPEILNLQFQGTLSRTRQILGAVGAP